jgi:hypothetical protein
VRVQHKTHFENVGRETHFENVGREVPLSGIVQTDSITRCEFHPHPQMM